MPLAPSSRSGFALATALVAIVLVGLLIAGSFFGSTQEFRAGRNAIYQERALTAAEYGQNYVLTDWNSDSAFAMANGAVRTRTITAQNGAVATVTLTKLNMLTFWVVSEGRTGAGTAVDARRRTGMIVRLDVPDMKIYGALTMRTGPGGNQDDAVGGNGSISGNDVNPAGWDCPPSGPAAAGVIADDTSHVSATGQNCGNYSCVSGSPQIVHDPTFADTANFFEFGGQVWQDLVAQANVIVPAGTNSMGSANNPIKPYITNGQCDRSIMYNWGDPTRTTVCANYFPIIWAKGDLSLVGGSGQGVLLVEGNLSVSGGHTFHGPVLVRGSLSSTGTGAHFRGGVMVGNVNRQKNSVLGSGSINFSRCAMLTALAPHARPTVSKRSWANMF